MNNKTLNNLFIASAPLVVKIMIFLFKKNISFNYTADANTLEEKISTEKSSITFSNGKIVGNIDDEFIKIIES